jgi:DtxR family Mn-dependent transcriptional regulator
VEHDQLSEAIEDYLKAILQIEEGCGATAVTTNALAARLGVSAGSASGMIRRLDEMGLAAHEPYRGVRLSDRGRRIALEVLRHHRLLELYLTQELGMSWDRVHDEAERLEHVLSEELEALIAAKLGDPVRDPHGDPIPSVTLEMVRPSTSVLSALEPGARGVLSRVSDSDPEMLRYLAARGIRLGDACEVLGRQPFEGPLTVRFGDHEEILGGRLADSMHVELTA